MLTEQRGGATGAKKPIYRRLIYPSISKNPIFSVATVAGPFWQRNHHTAKGLRWQQIRQRVPKWHVATVAKARPSAKMALCHCPTQA